MFLCSKKHVPRQIDARIEKVMVIFNLVQETLVMRS